MNVLAPIEWVMSLVLDVGFQLTLSHGLSIILMSLVVNFGLVPIYRITMRWREREVALQERMQPEIDKIHAVYSGRERHYYVRAIYRRYRYSPLGALRVASGLLVQIPFFLAAYRLLDALPAHDYEPFGYISNLGAPDGLLDGIHLLPLLMTAVNLATIFVQRRRNPSVNVQPLLLASGLFLLLLYTSASGLVLYWTTSNVFALVREIWTQRGMELEAPPPAHYVEAKTVGVGEQLFLGLTFGVFATAFLVENNVAMVPKLSVLAQVAVWIVGGVLAVFALCWAVLKLASAERLAPVCALALSAVLVFNGVLVETEILREGPSYRNALVALGCVCCLAWFLKRTLADTRLLGILFAAMALVLGGKAFVYNETRPPLAAELDEAWGAIKMVKKPNIYYLLPDSYASIATLQKLGIDVSEFTNVLSERGFSLYPNFFSSYHATSSTVPAMLNMAHHYYANWLNKDELFGSRAVVSGENNLNRLLQKEGYTTTAIQSTGYFLSGQSCRWDHCYPSPSIPLLVERAFLTKDMSSALNDGDTSFESEIDAALNRSLSNRPSFTYVHHHSLPGHTHNRGSCHNELETEKYAERVREANVWLLDIVEKIVARDPEAVVVVASDHGGYVTNNCTTMKSLPPSSLEVVDRMSAFAAIRWGKGEAPAQWDARVKTTTSLFAVIMSYLADTPALLSHAPQDDSFLIVARKRYKVVDDGELVWPIRPL